jgi:hypothetical protein
MKNRAITLFCFLAIAFFLGSCKAYRNLENINPKVPKEIQAGPFDKSELKKLIPGDRITVNATTGFKYYMVYQNYTGEKLVGSVWKVNDEKLETPHKTEIAFEEIDQVRVRKVSAPVTFVTVGIFGAIIILPIAAFLSTGLDLGW